MTKEEILGKTQGGLTVFRHFLTLDFKVGKNFLNPFYEDTKAACNVYFDKKIGVYKIKDFGDSRYNGDCFSFVATIKNLDISRKEDFKEILKIIEEELFLANPTMKFRQLPKLTETIETPTNTLENITFKDFSETELEFWKQYGIKNATLEIFKVVSIQQFHATNKNGKNYSIENKETEPVFGYKHKHFIKVYRLNSELRFQFLGEKSDNYVFGLDHLPPRGDVLFITGGEKDVLSLHAHDFFAICFNSENAAIPPEVIRKLSYRFRHIVLLYDVDKAGLDAVTHHQQKLKDFDIKVMLLPLSGAKPKKTSLTFFDWAIPPRN